MPGVEMARQVRLAMLEASVLALLRAAVEDGYDGVSVRAQADAGVSSIEVEFMHGNVPMAGESL